MRVIVSFFPLLYIVGSWLVLLTSLPDVAAGELVNLYFEKKGG
jgi:hypothetical protein